MRSPHDVVLLARDVAHRVAEGRQTVRQIAKDLDISSAYAHIVVHRHHLSLDPELYKKVKAVFEYHKSIKHLRGGEATKIKYRKKR